MSSLEVLPYPKNITHQRSPTRSHLNDLYFLFLALCQPFRIYPDANQLAKDLANLGRRNEVAFRAELVLTRTGLSCIVTAFGCCEALSHVRSYGNGACCLTLGLEHVGSFLILEHTVMTSPNILANGVDHLRSVPEDVDVNEEAWRTAHCAERRRRSLACD